MRSIDTIVIHHSVTPRDLPLQKSLTSFDNSHKDRLHPEANSLGYHIAYHWVIAGDGSKKQTRGIDEVGYHASSLSMNKKSLGICLTGNFDEENPSEAQLSTLRNLLGWIRRNYKITKIIGHRDVAGVTKTCPGQNLYNLLPKLIMETNPIPSDWATEAWEWAKKEGLVSDSSLPHATLTKEEMVLIMQRFSKLNK